MATTREAALRNVLGQADNVIYNGDQSVFDHETHMRAWRGVRDALDEALSLPSDDGWMPISTAPKDGTAILAWGRRYNEPVVVRYEGNEGWSPTYDGGLIISCQTDIGTTYETADQLSHWRPLPPPPTGDKE